MNRFIIGTAGHIDHGKTTLIRALTGRNTDKLKEEQERGISINLGFTYFDLPSGERCGIIDVPGHERFIKNMIAGAVGIDMCMLVISAVEGVMPQTMEHIEILSHLGIKDGVVVVSKCDLVDEELLDLKIEEIQETLKGTMFFDVPYIKIDSLSGRGIDEVIEVIEKNSKEIIGRDLNMSPRLNIDRCFSLKGLGTIVTGTLSEGVICVNDELHLYPKNTKVKVRNIQVHDENVQRAEAGQRTAINLTGIKREEISRGFVLTKEDSLIYTEIADVKITVGKAVKSIKMWDRVRVYIGTKEVLARVVPINTKEILSGETGYCQLRFEEGVYIKKDDPFVLRLFSPLITIGGGVVLNVNAKKHKDVSEKELETLINMENGSENSQCLEALQINTAETMSAGKLMTLLSTSKEDILEELNILVSKKYVVKVNDFYLHIDTYNKYIEETIAFLNEFHIKNPLKNGVNKEEIRNKVKTPYKLKDFTILLKNMEDDGIIKNTNSMYSLKDFKVTYNESQRKTKDTIENALIGDGFAPRKMSEIIEINKNNQIVLNSLIGNTIELIDKDTYIHLDYIEKGKEMIKKFIDEKGSITLADFRTLTNTSRKYSLMMLDYYDNKKFTKRIEDKRVLF